MEKIDFQPVAGLTIPQAFTRAIGMTKAKKRIIVVDINDVVMHIRPETNENFELNRFRELLQTKYLIKSARREQKIK